MNVQEMFPPDENGLYCDTATYDKIIEQLGTEVLRYGTNDYQGDINVVLAKEGQWGFTSIGYGSCFGCDALEGCDSYKELQDLADDIERGVRWFDTLGELKSYVCDKERAGSYFFHADGWSEFVREVEELTEGKALATVLKK